MAKPGIHPQITDHGRNLRYGDKAKRDMKRCNVTDAETLRSIRARYNRIAEQTQRAVYSMESL